jgi:PleD family two-component response regulator
MEAARPLAERFLASVRSLSIPWQDHRIRITVSLGLAELQAGEDGASWLGRADRALYEAKASGRDRLVCAPADANPAVPEPATTAPGL